MEIERTDQTIEVKLEGKTVRFDSEYDEEVNLLTEDGVQKVKEWEKDLVEKYGVELDELRS